MNQNAKFLDLATGGHSLPLPIPPQHDCNVICAADIKPEPVKWLWENRIPLGYITILAAPGGVGKSTIASSLAAVVTNGNKFPFMDDPVPLGDVVWISGEESIKYQLTPRAIVAGVDLNRLHFVESVKRQSGNGLMQMSADARQLIGLKKSYPDLQLVIVDPLSAFLDADDSNKDTDVRQVFTPWIEAANEAHVAIVFIAHWNKGKGGHVRDKLSGSTAIRNAARTVYVVLDDPDDDSQKLFLPEKCNLSDDHMNGLVFRIIGKEWSTDEASGEAPCIEWLHETDLRANDVTESRSSYSAIDDAQDFLNAELADGPKTVQGIRSSADKAGLAWRTVQRARDKLQIMSRKDKATGEWTWYTQAQWQTSSQGS